MDAKIKNQKNVIVIGSGNAALCAAIAAQQNNANVIIIEKADKKLEGGNSKYTAGAMRFSYNGKNQILKLIKNKNDKRIKNTQFKSYTKQKFENDLYSFNNNKPLTTEQKILIKESYKTIKWLVESGVEFEPIYKRQSFKKNGQYIFWGGLTLAAKGEGVGLVNAQMKIFKKNKGQIKYKTKMKKIIMEKNKVCGIVIENQKGQEKIINANAIVLACGGFEANEKMRKKYIGKQWKYAKVRGTPHNTGDGLNAAWEIGAQKYGYFPGCHATPMDLHTKEYGNLNIPHKQRKNYRKICYFLGIMINEKGERFVDEGEKFRNYTYAQFGKSVLEQPNNRAWQLFDAKIEKLLYEEYKFHDAHFVKAKNIEELINKMHGVKNKKKMKKTIEEYNNAVDENIEFDPTILDGKKTKGLKLPKSNWAQKIDKPPFLAYPITGGITFTYGGLKVNEKAQVMHKNGSVIKGLFACGEMVGGVFINGYPGGSGLTSGAVFGRKAGINAAKNK